MFVTSPSAWQIALAIGLVVAGALGGMLLDHVVRAHLARLSFIKRISTMQLVVTALRGTLFTWVLLIGLRGALLTLNLQPRLAGVLTTILEIAFVLSVTVAAARIAGGMVGVATRRTDSVLGTSSIFANLARAAILSLGLMIILQSVGVAITPLLTALGVGGLAVALALQDTLANIFAGLHIIASRHVQVGDFVRLGTGEEGYITDITWRNTTVRMLANNTVVVPNAKLAGMNLINFYRPAQELAVLVEVGVSYDSDLDRVEEVTVDVARDLLQTVPGGVPEFDPFIRFHTFGEFRIGFTVILRAREFADQHVIKHEFVKRLHRRYTREQIRIPFPSHAVYLERPEAWGQENGGQERRVGSQEQAHAAIRGGLRDGREAAW